MRNKRMLKAGLIGLALFALVGFAAAQAISVADRVTLVQAKRFEGVFRLSNGETSFKVGDSSAEWSINSGEQTLSASLAPQTGKPGRATLNVDGRTVEGKAAVEGRTLTMEFVDGKNTYRFKFLLTGRNEGEITVTQNDKTLVSASAKRV